MDSVYLNGFSLEILVDDSPVEKILYNNSNYFSLSDKSEYAIKLSNNHSTKADACVWIDDIKMGTWRINPYSKITIERPANINRKFTLLKEGTNTARNAGISNKNSSNGLIKITFKTEQKEHDSINMRDNICYNQSFKSYCSKSLNMNSTNSAHNMNNMNLLSNTESSCWSNSDSYDKGYSKCITSPSSLSAAGTALGDDSNQRFKTAKPLKNIDETKTTTIYARLAVDNKTKQRNKYMSLKEINNATSIPPPIGNIEPKYYKYHNQYDNNIMLF